MQFESYTDALIKYALDPRRGFVQHSTPNNYMHFMPFEREARNLARPRVLGGVDVYYQSGVPNPEDRDYEVNIFLTVFTDGTGLFRPTTLGNLGMRSSMQREVEAVVLEYYFRVAFTRAVVMGGRPGAVSRLPYTRVQFLRKNILNTHYREFIRSAGETASVPQEGLSFTDFVRANNIVFARAEGAREEGALIRERSMTFAMR